MSRKSVYMLWQPWLLCGQDGLSPPVHAVLILEFFCSLFDRKLVQIVIDWFLSAFRLIMINYSIVCCLCSEAARADPMRGQSENWISIWRKKMPSKKTLHIMSANCMSRCCLNFTRKPFRLDSVAAFIFYSHFSVFRFFFSLFIFCSGIE